VDHRDVVQRSFAGTQFYIDRAVLVEIHGHTRAAAQHVVSIPTAASGYDAVLNEPIL
jgi:hypothetical protein